MAHTKSFAKTNNKKNTWNYACNHEKAKCEILLIDIAKRDSKNVRRWPEIINYKFALHGDVCMTNLTCSFNWLI